MNVQFTGGHRVSTLLVVDDDEAVRVLMRRVLEGEGFQVWEASDGLQALGVLTQGLVGAVITDICMPRMDGWELAAHVAAMTPPLPILFTSAFDGHLRTTDLAGPILDKPFTPEALVASVRQLLIGAQTQSA